jgi:site-specific recombinase XerD
LTKKIISENIGNIRHETDETSWYRMVFALVAVGGICSDNAFSEIIDLRISDVIRCFTNQAVLVSRNGISYPYFVPKIVTIAILQRLIFLARRETGKPDFQKLPMFIRLIPGAVSSSDQMNADSQNKLLRGFERWLGHQIRQIQEDAPLLRFRSFVEIVRFHLMRIYPPYVVAAMSNRLLYSPVFYKQVYRRLDTSKKTLEIGKSTIEKPVICRQRPIDSQLENIIEVIKGYTDLDKNQARQQRGEVVRQLLEISNLIEEELLSKNDSIEALVLALKNKPGVNEAGPQIQLFNTFCYSRWLAAKIEKQSQNTVLCYLNLVRQLNAFFPDRLVISLTKAELMQMVQSRMRRNSSQERIKSNLNSLLGYLHKSVKIQPESPPMPLLNKIQPTEIFLPDMTMVLQIICELWESDQRCAVSLIFGAFWGLRIDETLNVTLDSVWLDVPDPVIFIDEPKRADHRWVVAKSLPAEIREMLYTFIGSRLASGAKQNDTLMGPGLSASRIEYVIRKTHDKYGLYNNHHLYRHFWVNRSLMDGMPLVHIGHLAHHRSIHTTVTKYVHVIPLVQRKIMEENPEFMFENLEIPISKLDSGLRRYLKMAGCMKYPEIYANGLMNMDAVIDLEMRYAFELD